MRSRRSYDKFNARCSRIYTASRSCASPKPCCVESPGSHCFAIEHARNSHHSVITLVHYRPSQIRIGTSWRSNGNARPHPFPRPLPTSRRPLVTAPVSHSSTSSRSLYPSCHSKRSLAGHGQHTRKDRRPPISTAGRGKGTGMTDQTSRVYTVCHAGFELSYK